MLRTKLFIIAVTLLIGSFSACSKDEPFSLEVVPGEMDALPGRRCVFLAWPEQDQGRGKIEITASAQGAEVLVEYVPINGNNVAEVTVIPDSSHLHDTLAVTVEGERGAYYDTVQVQLPVVDGFGTGEQDAIVVRDRFITWLAENHPEFGIDEQTSWTGTCGRPNILVVSHYLFFSEQWEMGISWHVMIAPHDWACIYLRARGIELIPSYAFEISSLSAEEDPYSIDPPDSVTR